MTSATYWGLSVRRIERKHKVRLGNEGSAGLALNKSTGEIIRQNGKGKCGYATPVLFQMDGQPCLAIMSEVTLFAVKQANQQKFNVPARAQVLPKSKCRTSPVLANGRIYARNANGDFVCVDVKK